MASEPTTELPDPRRAPRPGAPGTAEYEQRPEAIDPSGPGAGLRVDVVSDVVCPWCFIGKRQLERALQQWMHAHPGSEAPRVHWHPFQLNPDLPPGGISRDEYLTWKFGHADTSRLYANVRRAAEAAGLAMDFERIARQPNTLRAHAMIEAAVEDDRQQKVVEALFQGYFMEGRDLTDDDELVRIGLEAGMDEDRVRAAITDDELAARISDRDQQARGMGISGVPFFIFGGQVAVSGAQGEERLLMALERAGTGARDAAGPR